MTEPPETLLDTYERNQSFNALLAWLHSFRYRHLIAAVGALSRDRGAAVLRVVDIGCAHGRAFAVLNERFPIEYTGIEVEDSFVDTARARYQAHSNFSIVHDVAENQLDKFEAVDVVLALETLEHVPEHTVVRLVEQIARMQPRLFVCSVPVEIGPAIWIKNLGSLLTGYVRHREYTWRETFWAGLGKLDRLPSHGIYHKGFDWRWLAQTIRHNMRITETRTFPFRFLPVWLSNSVFFLAEPRSR